MKKKLYLSIYYYVHRNEMGLCYRSNAAMGDRAYAARLWLSCYFILFFFKIGIANSLSSCFCTGRQAQMKLQVNMTS